MIEVLSGDVAGDQCFVGEVRVGNNSLNTTQFEYDAGHNTSGDFVTGQRVWDANLADGFDSGQVAIQLVGNPGGGANGVSFSVQGGSVDPLNYSGVTYGTIQKVEVRAKVAAGGLRLTFSDLIVRFYKAGVLVETINVPAQDTPVASTWDTSSPASALFVVRITPENADPDKVVVDANVRLESQSTTLPHASWINGQILVAAASCATS